MFRRQRRHPILYTAAAQSNSDVKRLEPALVQSGCLHKNKTSGNADHTYFFEICITSVTHLFWPMLYLTGLSLYRKIFRTCVDSGCIRATEADAYTLLLTKFLHQLVGDMIHHRHSSVPFWIPHVIAGSNWPHNAGLQPAHAVDLPEVYIANLTCSLSSVCCLLRL